MKKTIIVMLALIFCFSISFAQKISLDAFIENGYIKVDLMRDKTPFDGKVDMKWEKPLLTPKQVGEDVQPPYGYFRVQEFLNIARPRDSQPYRTAVHESTRKVYHNFGIQYYGLKYLIEPRFVDILPEDKSYIFRFRVSKGYGNRIEVCYETPPSSLLILPPPTGGLSIPPFLTPKVYPVNADPSGEMFKNCGLRFHVYNYRRQSFGDYIEIESIEFSRSEVLNMLQEFILNESDEDLKLYAQAILQASTQAPPTPTQTCSDGTRYGECSSNKPKYCDEGVLVDDCVLCGCPSGQTCNTGTGQCEGIPPQPSAQTFTLRFFYDEVEKDAQGKTDYEMVRDNVVATWENRDLSVLPVEEAHEIVYKTRLSDYFEMREGSESGSLVNCSANSDFWGDTIEGSLIYYIIECENVKFNQDYVWIFKYKGTDGSIHKSVVNIRINGDGFIEWL